MNFGTTEILLIVAVLFLLFGASRLPQLAKSLGQTRKAFKEGIKEAEEEERLEQQQKQINPVSTVPAPQISAMSDEEIMAEMRRRVESKQQ
ncbi:MAG: twin-arginine translocase TatA/TatE family subunit [Acidobacteriota bacterium]|nr:twin-arginine translocase TatA/TatE family subunit [Acidobacteriota bacterium]